MIEVQDIFKEYGEAFLWNDNLPPHVHKVIRAIINGRTAELGDHVAFTLPSELDGISFQNQKIIYDLF